MLRFSHAPTLETDRLTLRPVAPEDAPAYYILRSDPQINRYTGINLCPSVEAAQAHIRILLDDAAAHRALEMTVMDRQSGAYAGSVCFWNLSEDGLEAELGYLFLSQFHGRGLAYEALLPFLGLGYDAFGFRRIIADPSPQNTASVRLLRKLGFTGGAPCTAPGRSDLCHFVRDKEKR